VLIKFKITIPAANALKTTFPHWDEQIKIVRSEDTLDLGRGHQLQFATVPTPRWPDGLCTYDPQTRILYTDKLFGVHVCSDRSFDENWKELAQPEEINRAIETCDGFIIGSPTLGGHAPIQIETALGFDFLGISGDV
jgi:flavorubredoxin